MGRAPKKKTEVFELVDDEVIPVNRPNRPAQLPESRQAQLVNLAVNLAEKQLREGTASSAVIVHYLKLGTKETELKLEALKAQNRLLDAKTTSIESAANQEQLTQAALDAFKSYAGNDDE